MGNKESAGYLTPAEVQRLARDAEYASVQHTYYARDADVIVRVWSDLDGTLRYEAKRKGTSKAIASGVLNDSAVQTWFGDIATEDWARA